jgi:hypothetical protein
MTRKRRSPDTRESRPDEAGPRLWRTFDVKFAAARLTERQRLFVVQYLTAPCGAKAARAAGYSPNRDRQQAYDNLRKPKIRRLVRQALYLHQRAWYVRAGLMPPDATRIPRHLRYKD